MKIRLVVLILGIALLGCTQKRETKITVNERGQKIALGEMTQKELLAQFPPFRKAYSAYSPDSAAVDSLKRWNQDLDVMIILGTWCPDSRREVGRFLRILDKAGNSHFHLQFIGVDRKKKDPEGYAKKYKIERVPTFIVLQNGREIGRIVERPKATLERDFLAILRRIKKSW